MPVFRPYGGEDLRLVSDLSRFDYEQGHPQKIRSRNATPTDPSSKITVNTIIPLYSTKIEDGNEYNALPDKDLPPEPQPGMHPYKMMKVHYTPPPVIENKPSIPQIQVQKVRQPKMISVGVQVTPKTQDPTPKSPTQIVTVPKDGIISNELPAMLQPTDVLGGSTRLSISSRQKQLEHDLIKNVMNRPLLKIKADRFGPDWEDKYIVISTNFFLYLLEVSSSIIEIVIASILLDQDYFISKNIYRYFIADGVLTLIIALMLICRLLDFEKRNGSFYCLAATIMKFVSFILIISTVFPQASYPTREDWHLRRTVGAFIIISTFLWVMNLIMFLTTLYISRLNLLEDLNFDYSTKGLSDEFNKPKKDRKKLEPKAEEQLQEFFLNENGEMYALTEDWEKEQYKTHNKILVYTF